MNWWVTAFYVDILNESQVRWGIFCFRSTESRFIVTNANLKDNTYYCSIDFVIDFFNWAIAISYYSRYTWRFVNFNHIIEHMNYKQFTLNLFFLWCFWQMYRVEMCHTCFLVDKYYSISKKIYNEMKLMCISNDFFKQQYQIKISKKYPATFSSYDHTGNRNSWVWIHQRIRFFNLISV